MFASRNITPEYFWVEVNHVKPERTLNTWLKWHRQKLKKKVDLVSLNMA